MSAVWEGKKYKNTESDKFDDYMKALGKCNKPKKKSFFFLFFSV